MRIGNFTSAGLQVGLFLLASLFIGMTAREWARAQAASKLGDPTPRLWGRLRADPRGWFEPFGSGLVPVLIVVLWAVRSTFLPPPVAYAKPAPIDPTYFKRRTRGIVLSSLAGPAANLLVAALASLVLRAHLSPTLERLFVSLEFANLCLCFFHLLPIPGLDGARMVALLLPPNIAITYRNADKYLPLFVLVVLFVFAGPILSIVYSLAHAVCGLFSGGSCNVQSLLNS